MEPKITRFLARADEAIATLNFEAFLAEDLSRDQRRAAMLCLASWRSLLLEGGPHAR